MPRQTPTLEDIALPGVQGQRPVAGYDVSAWGRGAEALAKSGQILGTDIQKSATDIAETQTWRARQAVETGKLGLATQYLQNRAQYSQSNDPEDLDRWRDANKKAADDVRSKIPSPDTALGAHAHAAIGEMDATEGLHIAQRQRVVDGGIALSGIQSSLDTVRKHIRFDPNETPDATIDAATGGIHDQIDNAVSRNLMTREQGQQLKQHSAKIIADQFVADMVENHPDEYKKFRGTWTPQAKRTKAYGADNSGPQLEPGAPPASTGADSGGGVPSSIARIAETVNNGETPNGRNINVRSLGQISRDTNNSKSYGFMGLNSASGSLADFSKTYGANFGLRAPPGSAAFDAQWHAAALDQPAAFRDAQLSYFQDKHVAPVAGDLTRLGIPANVANDPRVVTYFADRHVQMDTIGLNRAASAAWQASGGDPVRFLRNMNAIDGRPENMESNFHSAIASGVYGPEGHASRLQKRLAGALSAGDADGRGAMPDDKGHPFFGLMDPVELLRFDTRANIIINQRAADQAALNAQRSLKAAQGWQGMLGQAEEGLAEIPPRDAIANDPNLDDGHRNTLLAHRATLVKQLGREALQSQADLSADALALYNRNIIETRAGRAELIPLDVVRNDPHLTEEHRNRILEARQVEEGRLGREVTKAQADASAERHQQYALAIEDAKNGRGPIPALDVMRNDPLIKGTPHELALTKAYDEATSGGAGTLDRTLAKIKQDPAAYASQNVPVVAQAWGKLQDAVHGGAMIDPATAVRDYAELTMGVQQAARENGGFGLSPHEMNLVPQSYIKDLALQVAHPEVEGGADKVAKRLEAEQKLWGPTYWPQVFRQISAEKGLPAPVRVVASGVDEIAGRKLLEMSGKTFPEILRDENTERAGTIKSDVLKAMAPFMRSLTGASDETDVFNDFRGQAEKLAADYVVHGKTSSDAAAQAFKDLLGKYDFVDGGFGRDAFRIPKTREDGSPNTFTSGEIQDGARWARDHLADLNVIPPAVASGLGEQYRVAAPLNSYRRDAVWATASGDVGLRLVYNGETVRTKDGKPLVLTWGELADMAKQQSPAGFRGTAAAAATAPLVPDVTSAFGPRPTEQDIARLEREQTQATARREEEIKATAGNLAAGRARMEAVMTPGTPEREAAMQRARERNMADQAAELDRQEQVVRTRAGMRKDARERELARIAAERAKLKGSPPLDHGAHAEWRDGR